jgi:hypothetical protein
MDLERFEPSEERVGVQFYLNYFFKIGSKLNIFYKIK